MDAVRVLLVATECYPLAKTTGLGDVVGALPAPLADQGVDAQVLVPAYPSVLEHIAAAGVSIVESWDDLLGETVRLVRGTTASGLRVWAVEAPSLYARPSGGLYVYPDPEQPGRNLAWPDNHLRFGLLCRVAARVAVGAVPQWRPEVIHLHDWQSGLGALHIRRGDQPGAPTVFTIHNLLYSGEFPCGGEADQLSGVLRSLGLPADHVDSDCMSARSLSFLRAGLAHADHLTAVSQTYATEIAKEPGAMGHADLLAPRARRGELTGIRNGVDLDVWNPGSDQLLDPELRYTVEDLGPKKLAKQHLKTTAGLDTSPRRPLVGVVSRLSEQKGVDLLLDILPELLRRWPEMDVAILGMVLDPAETDLEARVLRVAGANQGRVAATIVKPLVAHDERLPHLMQAGLDVLVVPSRFEPCGLTQLYALRYGTVPVVARTGGLADTVLDDNDHAAPASRSTGFQFRPGSASDLSEALDRCLRTYGDSAAWHRTQRRAMRSDVGWEGPAREYADLYRSLRARARRARRRDQA
jgi:starch synthase